MFTVQYILYCVKHYYMKHSSKIVRNHDWVKIKYNLNFLASK